MIEIFCYFPLHIDNQNISDHIVNELMVQRVKFSDI